MFAEGGRRFGRKIDEMLEMAVATVGFSFKAFGFVFIFGFNNVERSVNLQTDLQLLHEHRPTWNDGWHVFSTKGKVVDLTFDGSRREGWKVMVCKDLACPLYGQVSPPLKWSEVEAVEL